MLNRGIVALALIAGAGVASAAGTITSGTASYNSVGTWSSTTSGNGTFITGTGISDQLFKNTWYYRTPSNNQNRFFSSLDTPTEVWSGNTATITYTNAGPGAAGVERFNAVFTLTITQTGAGAARVDTKLVFTNTNSTAKTYQVFNLVDMDLNATATNDTISMLAGSGNQIAKSTDASASNIGYHAGYGATRYYAGLATGAQSAIGSGSSNLGNVAGPSTGDVGSAFQWELALGAGQSATIYASFAINTNPVPTPGAAALLGLAGVVAGRRRR